MDISRREKIEAITEYLVQSADLDMLLSFYEEKTEEYLEGLSKLDLDTAYAECIGEDE